MQGPWRTHLAFETAALQTLPLSFHARLLPPHADITATTVFGYFAGLAHPAFEALQRWEGGVRERGESVRLPTPGQGGGGIQAENKEQQENWKGTRGRDKAGSSWYLFDNLQASSQQAFDANAELGALGSHDTHCADAAVLRHLAGLAHPTANLLQGQRGVGVSRDPGKATS